jgi:DNA-directed RNA polymerase specialized sigma24 family protein
MNPSQFILRHAAIRQTVQQVLGRQTRDRHLIDDLCQDVLLMCWEHEVERGNLPSDRFVTTAALNLHRTWLRKLCRNRRFLETSKGDVAESSEDDPALLTEMADRFVILLSLLDGLPARSREIAKRRIVEPTFRTRVRELYFPLRRGQKEKLQDPPPG